VGKVMMVFKERKICFWCKKEITGAWTELENSWTSLHFGGREIRNSLYFHKLKCKDKTIDYFTKIFNQILEAQR
jgi:hypothetical protein